MNSASCRLAIGTIMRVALRLLFLLPIIPNVSAGISAAQENPRLRLVQTIPLPGLKGRIDHMDIDVKGRRLFVAGLENGTLEVVDLSAGKWLKSVSGFQKPQGVLYVESLNKLFVASGDDGMVRVFRGDTLDLADSVKLDTGANRIAYDAGSQVLFVGYGGKDAGKDYGEVGFLDARSDKRLAAIRVSSHPAELLLDQAGKALFVFLPAESKILKIDLVKRETVAAWPVSSQRPGDGALDAATHRLFLGTRTPAAMIAMNSQSGKEVAKLATVDGQDGVYFDSVRKRVYVSGGRGEDIGYVCVYQQKDADHYEAVAQIPTRPGAGTSFWSPEMNRYYVAAPAHGNEAATILVFEPQP